MHSFRLRLILALIAGVTVVSVVSTYLEVLAYKHNLREELEWRSTWMGASIRSQVESALAAGNASALPDMVERLRAQIGVLGVGVYDPDGHRTVSAGAPAVFADLARPPFESLAKTPVQSLARTQVEKSIKRGTQMNAFGHTGDTQWLERCFRCTTGSNWKGRW